MKNPRPFASIALLSGFFTFLGLPFAHAAENPEPLWAYGFLTAPSPGDKAVPQTPPSRNLRSNETREVQTALHKVPGSHATFSKVDMRDGHNVADWFPNDHPAMSPVIAHGPAALGSAAMACAFCHLPTGKGRPENAPVAGQPAVYFIRQLEDFKHGARMSADPRKPNTPTMIALAQAMSAEEMKAAAEYFGAMKWTPWTRVIETELVPKTRIVGNLFLPLEKERTEPIAGRIIEVPEDEEQSEGLRNPHAGFIAYVPVGSLKRGESLVKTGNPELAAGNRASSRTVACAACHGIDLLGAGEVPGIAGRSPSYLVRQLYDLQQGKRKGASAALMQPAVAQLTNDDMVDIAAYVTSLVQ